MLTIIAQSTPLQAQNVGINTNTPQATLDVRGNPRFGGLSSFITYDSITGRIEWRNSNLYVPVTQALMKHSAAADGLFYNNTSPVSGQLEYRNAMGEPVFFTNFTNGNGHFKNFLGIGTATPTTNLHIETNNINPFHVNGGSQLYLSWAENGVNRGYLGSYAGDTGDVDFGTYNGNPGKIHFTTYNIPRMTIAPSGNAGIGTVNPLARLHVTDSAVLFSADGDIPSIPNNVPLSGAGRRMMWYPDKAAFRAGYVDGAQWDKDSIGSYSIAAGYNTKANAFASVAMGFNTTAGHASTAFGFNSIASGSTSTAMGLFTVASGHESTAMGYGTVASGVRSTSMGYWTSAKALGSLAIGLFNDNTDNPLPDNPSDRDRIFQIGNGTGVSTRSNALTLLRTGSMGIGTVSPQARLHVADSSVLFSAVGDVPVAPINPPVSGAGRRMMWYADKAAFRAGYVQGPQWDKDSIGKYSFATGYSSKATGVYSTSIGLGTTAAGINSTAMGQLTIASGLTSTAMGTSTTASGTNSTATGYSTMASGDYSTSMGDLTTASGYGSISMGELTIAKAYTALTIGRYNDNTDNPGPSPAATDRIFQIGNGNSSIARSNALTVLRNGNTGIGTTAPQASLEVNGYTMLGSSAPKIQMIKITGTTAASQGGAVNFVHGLPSSKILSVELLVEYTSTSFVQASYRASPGYEVNFYFTATHIYVENVTGNSSAVLSKPLKLLITYEQ